MKFIENMINMKLNTITGNDLLKYAEKANISVTKSQAEQVAAFIRGKNFNLFDDRDRTKIIKEIARIAGPKTAKQVNDIFKMFLS
ncbi:MAG: DUF2624 domain-containing protein [Caldibacillus sp.]